jgi:hypothetical protein
MFMVLIAIQACLIIYHDPTPENTPIWAFVNSLNQWNTIGFILGIAAIAAGIGLVGITAASVFGFKTDFLIFAPAMFGFITMGIVFTNLAKVIQSDLIGYIFTTCDINHPINCAPVNLCLVPLGIVALYYVWTVVEWWRGKDY